MASSHKKTNTKSRDNGFTRMWVACDNIRCKVRERDMYLDAQRFDLTGFYVIDKPGFIVFEGLTTNAEQLYAHLKGPEIGYDGVKLKYREDEQIEKDGSLESLRKFFRFESKTFLPKQTYGGEMKSDRREFCSWIN